MGAPFEQPGPSGGYNERPSQKNGELHNDRGNFILGGIARLAPGKVQMTWLVNIIGYHLA